MDIDYLLGRYVEPNKYLTILIRAQKELSEEDLKSLEDMAEYLLYRNKKRKSEKRKKLEIKDIIKNRRLELDLTLRDIAEYVRVSPATVSRWESGDIANMRRDKITLLSTVLQIDPVSLMD